jgi:hypothetical protein
LVPQLGQSERHDSRDNGGSYDPIGSRSMRSDQPEHIERDIKGMKRHASTDRFHE